MSVVDAGLGILLQPGSGMIWIYPFNHFPNLDLGSGAGKVLGSEEGFCSNTITWFS
jgi:hypothetical protein